jgi:hypothetical protein
MRGGGGLETARQPLPDIVERLVASAAVKATRSPQLRMVHLSNSVPFV